MEPRDQCSSNRKCRVRNKNSSLRGSTSLLTSPDPGGSSYSDPDLPCQRGSGSTMRSLRSTWRSPLASSSPLLTSSGGCDAENITSSHDTRVLHLLTWIHSNRSREWVESREWASSRGQGGSRGRVCIESPLPSPKPWIRLLRPRKLHFKIVAFVFRFDCFCRIHNRARRQNFKALKQKQAKTGPALDPTKLSPMKLSLARNQTLSIMPLV